MSGFQPELLTRQTDLDEVTWLHEEARKSQDVVEVGCWMGGTTHALATGCTGMVYAVDNWSPDYFSREVNATTAYREFMKNTSRLGNLVIIRMRSTDAAKLFADKSVDMVFIDGSHDFQSVVDDITAWRPKAKRLLCGHDYGCLENTEVIPAVDHVLGKPDGVVNTVWYVRCQ
jgi:hypothetical protein